MKTAGYWWGVELFPETDEEWDQMKSLFTDATVLFGYDNDKESAIKIWDQDIDGIEKDFYYNDGTFMHTWSLIPQAVQSSYIKATRCITIGR
jgi:hypothetical protein